MHFTPRALTGLGRLDRRLKPLGQFACPLDLAAFMHSLLSHQVKFSSLLFLFLTCFSEKNFAYEACKECVYDILRNPRHTSLPTLREAS